MNTFENGEIVLAPRTRGGFTFSQVIKQAFTNVCFYDSAVSHKTPICRVIYKTNQGILQKDLPFAYLGKLKIPPPITTSDLDPDTTSDSSEILRVVGEPPHPRDLQRVVFSPTVNFEENEIVLLPRSAGGFTYGRLHKESQQNCRDSSVPSGSHPIPAWRVIVSESSSGNVNRKDVPSASLGKVTLVTHNDVAKRKLFSYASREGALGLRGDLATLKESEISHEEVEKIHQKMEQQRESSQETSSADSEIDMDSLADALVPLPSENPPTIPRVSSTPEMPPPDLTSNPSSNPTPREAYPTLVNPNPKTDVSQINLKEISGIIPVDKRELLKSLMSGKRPNTTQDKKHLIVIDGPNVAKVLAGNSNNPN